MSAAACYLSWISKFFNVVEKVQCRATKMKRDLENCLCSAGTRTRGDFIAVFNCRLFSEVRTSKTRDNRHKLHHRKC